MVHGEMDFEKEYKEKFSGMFNALLFCLVIIVGTKSHCDKPTPPNGHNILIIGPMWLEQFLQDFEVVEPLFFHFVDCDELRGEEHGLADYLREELSIKKLQTVQVIHSFPSYGVVLETDSWKFVYSGDTRPCEELIQAGKGAHIVLHEANFEEDMLEKAKGDRHSTLQEVCLVGHR